MGLNILKTPFRAPQANAFCERLVGTIRRECLDFLIPLYETHLRKILKEWVAKYNQSRPHLSLGPGIPEPSGGMPAPPVSGIPCGHRVVRTSISGSLHHEYRLEKVAGLKSAEKIRHDSIFCRAHLLPEIERQQELGKKVAFRADAAHARPQVYEALEERGVKYAIRITASESLDRDIAEPAAAPGRKTESKAVAGVQRFPLPSRELEDGPAGSGEASRGRAVPRVGFIVNLSLPNRAGGTLLQPSVTSEQWIKEGKQAVKMTRLSCHRFRSNEARLWLSAIAYNLGTCGGAWCCRRESTGGP